MASPKNPRMAMSSRVPRLSSPQAGMVAGWRAWGVQTTATIPLPAQRPTLIKPAADRARCLPRNVPVKKATPIQRPMIARTTSTPFVVVTESSNYNTIYTFGQIKKSHKGYGRAGSHSETPHFARFFNSPLWAEKTTCQDSSQA